MSGIKRPAPTEWSGGHDRGVWQATKLRAISGEFTDLVIECGGQKHKVHKLVMSASPFFAKATQGPFKEAKEGIIRLPDDDPNAIKAMIDYLYHGCYGKDLRPPPEQGETIHTCLSDFACTKRNPKPTSPEPVEVSSGPSDESSGDTDSSGTDDYTSEEEDDENALVNGDGNEWRQAHDNINAQAPIAQANAQASGRSQARDALRPAASRTTATKKEEGSEADAGGCSVKGMPAAVACFDLPLDAMVYGLAEKYGLPAMKELALKIFETTMSMYPRNVLQDPFREAATIAYDSTPDADRTLRAVIVSSITHFEFASDCPQIRQLLDEVPGLETDVNAGLFKLVAKLRWSLRSSEEKCSRLQAHYDFGEAFDGKHVRVGRRLFKPH